MFVKGVMVPKEKCFTVQKGESAKDVLQLMETHKIDGVPVLDGSRFEGVATRYNLYKAFFESEKDKSSFFETATALDLATHTDTAVRGDEIFENALFELQDFPLLPVVSEQNEFEGIVTRYDVVTQFQSAFGMNKRGVRIAITSVETEGQLTKLSEIIKQYRESVISLVTFDETDKLVRRIVLKVKKKDNLDRFLEKLEQSGFRVLDMKED